MCLGMDMGNPAGTADDNPVGIPSIGVDIYGNRGGGYAPADPASMSFDPFTGVSTYNPAKDSSIAQYHDQWMGQQTPQPPAPQPASDPGGGQTTDPVAADPKTQAPQVIYRIIDNTKPSYAISDRSAANPNYVQRSKTNRGVGSPLPQATPLGGVKGGETSGSGTPTTTPAPAITPKASLLSDSELQKKSLLGS